MKHTRWLALAIGVISLPAAAHPGHPPASTTTPATRNPAAADNAAVEKVLSQYKAAIERLDASGTEQLFATESAIFEGGGSEGTYANYLAHHLAPELAEFRSFKFSNYKVQVRLLGPDAAHAIETYTYRIETKTGEVVDRLGVATSVLGEENGTWKIVVMHNSSRRPKAS